MSWAPTGKSIYLDVIGHIPHSPCDDPVAPAEDAEGEGAGRADGGEEIAHVVFKTDF